MFESLMGNRKKLVDNKTLAHKVMKTDIRKTVGARFIAAREMNGWSQGEASAKIGYKTSAQLCLWEQGKRLPPIDQMIIASMVYGTSLDYLYGLSDEPERDPRAAEQQAIMRQMQDMLTANAQAVAGALMVQVRSGGPSMVTVNSLNAKAASAAASIRKFQELNHKKFDDLRGGNTLMVAAAALEECTREAVTMLTRQEGIKEQSVKQQEGRYKLHYPLFETPEYRQGQLGLAA